MGGFSKSLTRPELDCTGAASTQGQRSKNRVNGESQRASASLAFSSSMAPIQSQNGGDSPRHQRREREAPPPWACPGSSILSAEQGRRGGARDKKDYRQERSNSQEYYPSR